MNRLQARAYSLMERYCVACWALVAAIGIGWWMVRTEPTSCLHESLPAHAGLSADPVCYPDATACFTPLPQKAIP